MPNFVSQFCEVIGGLSDDEKRWVRRSIGQRRRFNEGLPEFEYQINGDRLECWSLDSGEEMFVDFAQAFLARWRPGGYYIMLEVAHTASRPVVEGFGGSACLITADSVKWMDTYGWMLAQLDDLEETTGCKYHSTHRWPPAPDAGAPFQEATKYQVVLSSAGNPGLGQDPTQPLYGVPVQHVEIDTLEDAVALCKAYICEHDLGSGNWNGGQILANGRPVAEVAYNCSVLSGPFHVDGSAKLAVDTPMDNVEALTVYPNE